jgi:7,8-dihydropterin-6-yl-methyl-4-(beta-D-ribofuranosyl)aminobenzene 5'-phosphate synthase
MDLQPEDLIVTVVYDNRSGAEGLVAKWGFACLVRGLEKTILFDTGGDSPTLLGNMARLGISPGDVDVVVLSHAHGDHTGGLAGFLEIHSDVTVYPLEAFPAGIGTDARARGAEVVRISGPLDLCPGATLTGALVGESGIPEQALLLWTNAGAAVVTGCAHPGIVNIVEQAEQGTGRDVVAVIGGFHLFRESDRSVRRVVARLQELGVQCVVPCHCSGDEAIQIFAEAYGERFVECSAGTVIPVGRMLRRTQTGEQMSE